VKQGIYFTILSVLLTLVSAPVSLQSSSNNDDCEEATVKVQMIDGAGLMVVDGGISYGAGENRLALRNETGRTIVSLTVIVNYVDSNGDSIYSVPFFGTVDESTEPQKGLRPYIKTILQHPISPNETFPLWGTNLESTRIRPARANVTYVQIVDTLGNGGFVVTAPTTEPLLLKSPEFFELNVASERLPDGLELTLSIDDRGRVSKVDFERLPPGLDDLAGQVRAQLMLWSFFPATEGWSAVPAKLALWLDFHDKDFPLPKPTCPLTLSENFPRTFVQVDLSRVSAERWEVEYEGQYAHGAFNTIVSTFLRDPSGDDSREP
jgi:hypothetical protein